jgi:hypothetical protein
MQNASSSSPKKNTKTGKANFYRFPLLIPSPTSLLPFANAALALSARSLASLTSTGSGKSPNPINCLPMRTPPDPDLTISSLELAPPVGKEGEIACRGWGYGDEDWEEKDGGVVRNGGKYCEPGADWRKSGLGFRTCGTCGDGTFEALENMLFGGAFGIIGEYVNDFDGEKEGATGFNFVLECVRGSALLFDMLAFVPQLQVRKGAYFSRSVTIVHSSNRWLSLETSKREPLLVFTSSLTSRIRS